MASRYPTQDSYTAQKEIRLVIIGRTGSGKSATGNTILGKPHFASERSASSVTRTCEIGEVEINNTNYQIIDTPGLFDTKIGKAELSKEVVRCVSMSNPGPHLFLLVVQVGRFTTEEIGCFQQMFELFGDRLEEFSLIVFTGKDQLEGKTIEEYVGDCVELRKIIKRCKNNYITINNKSRDNDKAATLLLNRVNSIIAANRGNHYSNEMFREAERAIKRKVDLLKKQKEMEKQQQINKIRESFAEQIERSKQNNEYLYQKLAASQKEKRVLQQSGQLTEMELTNLNRKIRSKERELRDAEIRAAHIESTMEEEINAMSIRFNKTLSLEMGRIRRQLNQERDLNERLNQQFQNKIKELQMRHAAQLQTLQNDRRQLTSAIANATRPVVKSRNDDGCTII